VPDIVPFPLSSHTPSIKIGIVDSALMQERDDDLQISGIGGAGSGLFSVSHQAMGHCIPLKRSIAFFNLA
jgi:hypothetical protein